MKSASLVKPHYDEEGFDTLICDDALKLYAVFDGMGVSHGARRASKLARDVLLTAAQKYELTNGWQGLIFALEHFIDISKRQELGGTTGTVVTIDPAGVLHYAHAGDSRLYVLHKGRVKQITADEGVNNMLLNYLGRGSRGIVQAGYIQDWDSFMICSDGISGDWPEQLVDDQTIEKILRSDVSPEMKIDALIAVSKKPDDKAVVLGEA